MQVVWIQFSGIPEGYYSNCLLRATGQTVALVVKLDVHTDCARRGRFARLAVCVDFRKPLVSKVRINGRLQQVEYEALPNIFFKCGLYRHGADLCSGVKTTSPVVDSYSASPVMEKLGLEQRVEKEPFGP
ncbi:hypothetical protein Godav_010261 [Gossypium davidsonii]|uniref:DUF4283 domain-containing protein n=1 Tax=Gossypium davidsonii TaxID=34287 RepID=A0A7J8SHM9_GOSDV|nr:hypothetical protein [Gossypium davidsonii]